MNNHRKGFAWIPILVILTAISAGVLVFKPKFIDGESRRASASTAATAKVEQTTQAQGAAAAAGIAEIGIANSDAPDSLSKQFIGHEVPSVLSKLPAPDPIALLEAEKRRSAVMEGRIAEISSLYEKEAKKSALLQKDVASAKTERKEVDIKLEQTAALHLGEARQKNILIAVSVVLGALYVYSRIYRVSPTTIGNALADIRAGVNPVNALDTHLAPWLHPRVKKASQLATEPIDKNT